MNPFDYAIEILQSGGPVAFPTETVYGLGANVWDPLAVARVFELKGRPRFDPLIVHVAESDDARQLWADIPPAAVRLIERFWPGPLTLVLPKQPRVPALVTAGLTTVGVRCPRHQLARELISAVGFPLAAPSANRFGRISPTTAEHVRESFAADSPHVLDGGPCQIGLESTIIGWHGEQAVLLRPGGVPREEIERLVGPLTQPPVHGAAVRAPGMLPSHYAPRTPLEIIGPTTHLARGQRLGLLSFREPMDKCERFTAIEVLSVTGDLREAAANFFAALRRLDDLQLDRIFATPVPTHGVGLAMTDRLTRAAAAFHR